MAISLSSTTLPATQENTDIAQTITVGRLLVPPDPAISSVVVNKGANTAGNIVITVGNPELITGNVDITFSGRYNDNFTKTITYEDGNKQVQTVTKFADIEPGYNFVSEYLAGSSGTLTASYSVVVNGSEIGTVTQVINNNYTPGKDFLIQFVAQGKY
jgi:hypothetical protein